MKMYGLFGVLALAFSFSSVWPARAEDPVFHLPLTEAEKALDDFLKKGGQRDFLTLEFLDVLAKQKEPCRSGQRCFSCSQDLRPDIQYLTVEETDRRAVIFAIEAQDDDRDRPIYHLEKKAGRWRLAGAYCQAGVEVNVSSEFIESHCHSTAMTQAEMTICEARHAARARNDMYAAADEVRHLLSGRPEKQAAFETAQKAWEAYAEAEENFLDLDNGGSVASECRAATIKTFARERAQRLRRMIEKSAEDTGICSSGLSDSSVLR